jgi:hypothetical protein
MVIVSEQVSVIPVKQVTIKIYVPVAVGIPVILKTPVAGSNTPLTPSGKTPEVIEADVAPLDEVKVIGVNELLTQTDSNKDEAVTVQLQPTISTVATTLNAGHEVVAGIS